MLLHSAEKAINAVSKLGADTAPDEEAYFVIGTAVHWTADCIGRLTDDEQNIDGRFLGLKFANNCLKHETAFEKAHITEGHKFPFEFPYDYGTHYVWTSLDDMTVRYKHEKLCKKAYKETLEGKNVYIVLKQMLDKIKELYQNK